MFGKKKTKTTSVKKGLGGRTVRFGARWNDTEAIESGRQVTTRRAASQRAKRSTFR